MAVELRFAKAEATAVGVAAKGEAKVMVYSLVAALSETENPLPAMMVPVPCTWPRTMRRVSPPLPGCT